uniref:Uncharacterized protein n=1 Tax=Chromera velia CCMP2878 TaxID=1169474 RepID=A0A0G4I1X6_9ALVE|eukprot:Cvel_34839.t1-p1 / transcript=Cvel_34839.t1 / gene=Cvel_34839 / organism=Chromera_velia_CCMP2878 / gene_product=hypothetical protein / transcript_product=hypothetical protein / location=Cvel_scaffold6127:31-459(-) / protein_length=143 / sequence_SO=supercontig / SO=protein_coding / is_pseudo=false
MEDKKVNVDALNDMLSATSSYSESGGEEEEEEEEEEERKEETEKDKEEKSSFDLTQLSTVLRNEIIPSVDKIVGKKLKKGLGPLKKRNSGMQERTGRVEKEYETNTRVDRKRDSTIERIRGRKPGGFQREGEAKDTAVPWPRP